MLRVQTIDSIVAEALAQAVLAWQHPRRAGSRQFSCVDWQESR
jgi:hypothetical protein